MEPLSSLEAYLLRIHVSIPYPDVIKRRAAFVVKIVQGMMSLESQRLTPPQLENLYLSTLKLLSTRQAS